MDPTELDRCLELLERIADERTLLRTVDEPRSRRLLIAAGRISRPERYELTRLAKARRRDRKRRDRDRDEALLDETQLRRTLAAPLWVAPAPQREALPPAPDALELSRPRACYVCKAQFTRVHFFYDQMCPDCADLNYAKRMQTADLSGKTALVTGGRIKIGYQTVLLLLRAGARVIVSTRFPHDAAIRFAREPDADAWRSRLHVYGLDLRYTPAVEIFSRHVLEAYDRVDVLVNNAAQTVRRPPAYYAHLAAGEAAVRGELPPHARETLAHFDQARTNLLVPAGEAPLVTREDLALFPPGQLDPDLQQVDLRTVNSWRLPAAEVPTVELLEVHLVNAIAPFVLASRLRARLASCSGGAAHVINVSAMEASFSRGKKTDKHPHTNMAKAALNMLTRTSAQDFARDQVWMNSVWDPLESTCRHASLSIL